jgi:hypothetical protein
VHEIAADAPMAKTGNAPGGANEPDRLTMVTTRKTVTFAKPFMLSDVAGILPAGRYDVDTVGEAVDDLSAIRTCRRSTLLHVSGKETTQVFNISPVELDAALMRDAGWTVVSKIRDT